MRREAIRMSTCNLCGKETGASVPMVLVGNKCFIQSAGNGRAWVGQAPSIRYWKTFALLSVSVCPECQDKERHKLSNKIFQKHKLSDKHIFNEISVGAMVVKHYRKAKKIPGGDILALPGQLPGAAYDDIDMKATMMIDDPWLGSSFKEAYELDLYEMEELDKIGSPDIGLFDNDAFVYAPNKGLEEARATAQALFERIR